MSGMRWGLVFALLFLAPTLAQTDDEITIELPGGVPLEMVWIEPGNFTMGTQKPESGLGVTREVTISRGFYLGKYEITREQWQAVMGTAPWSSSESGSKGPGLPASISWHDAQAFTHRLNDHFGEDTYRLPTEAEWEYACRAGTTTRWFFGDDETLLASYAWYEANAKALHPVGQKLPNPWGLFDMYGNAREWVYDRFGTDRYDGRPKTDPSGPFWGYFRTQRGGGYKESADYTTSASTMHYRPEYGEVDFGARLFKGKPLDIPVATPFPQDSSGPFLPVHEGNIWIMACHKYDPYGPPGVFIKVYELEKSEVIDGRQYWDWEGHVALPMVWSSFRVDETGIWELIQDRWTSNAVHDLLTWLNENPELRESQYYQQSSFFQSLVPEQKELLLYDFDGGAFDYEDSSTFELDKGLMNEHWNVFSSERYVQGEMGSLPNRLSFSFVCCGTEAGGGIVFQRGLGPVTITWNSNFGGESIEELVWARINGEEYGLHPGPDYPGYRRIETVVAAPEVTSPHPVASGLSPNFPNPFNSSTRIAYHLATPGPVRLEIYNVLGQSVRTLVNQFQPAGSYQVPWDVRNQEGPAVAAGVYLVRLQYPGGEQTRRLLLLK